MISWKAPARVSIPHRPKTSSPDLKSLTDSPTESMIPAASNPRTAGQDCTITPKLRAFQSSPFKAIAWVRIHISSGPGVGYGVETLVNVAPCLGSWYWRDVFDIVAN